MKIWNILRVFVVLGSFVLGGFCYCFIPLQPLLKCNINIDKQAVTEFFVLIHQVYFRLVDESRLRYGFHWTFKMGKEFLFVHIASSLFLFYIQIIIHREEKCTHKFLWISKVLTGFVMFRVWYSINRIQKHHNDNQQRIKCMKQIQST